MSLRIKHAGLLLALFVYVALRGLILYTAFDQAAMPQYELYPMGTLPKALLEGIDFPLRLYYDNAAGQIVTGIAAVPFYVLFGQTYLALKLVPATLGFLALIATYFFLLRGFGRRAAVVGAFLFALGPVTALTKYSLFASGNHFENMLFSALALLCFYRLHTSERRAPWLALSGFTAGLAIFVFLGAITAVGLLALVHLGARGWSGTAKDLRTAGPAFVLGILPLLVLNLQTSGRGLAFLGRKFEGDDEHGLGHVLARIYDFLAIELPRAGFYDSFLGMSKTVANLAFLAAFVVAWSLALPAALRGARTLLAGARRAELAGDESRRAFERMKLLPLVFYLPLTAVAYGLSDLRVGEHIPPMKCAGYRYFLPHFQFAILLIAILSARWVGAGAKPALRALGLGTAALALATGLWNLSYLDFGLSEPNLGAHYRGYNFMQAARGLLNPRNGLSQQQVREHADALAPLYRRRIYGGIGFDRAGLQWLRREKRGRGQADFLDTAELVAGHPPDVQADMARGAGSFLLFQSMQREPATGPRLVTENLARLQREGAPFAGEVAEGSAYPKDFPDTSLRTASTLNAVLGMLPSLAPEVRPAAARGIGLLCGRLLRREIRKEELKIEAVLRAIPDELQDEALLGLGWGLADGAESSAITPAAAKMVPAARRAPLRRGFGACLVHVYGAEEAQRRLAALSAEWRE